MGISADSYEDEEDDDEDATEKEDEIPVKAK